MMVKLSSRDEEKVTAPPRRVRVMVCDLHDQPPFFLQPTTYIQMLTVPELCSADLATRVNEY
jgi:hypothetical protein